MFYSQREEKPCPLNSVMKPSELLRQGYIVHWCYAINNQPKEEQAEDIPIVCEFKDVLLKSYRVFPPKRKQFLD